MSSTPGVNFQKHSEPLPSAGDTVGTQPREERDEALNSVMRARCGHGAGGLLEGDSPHAGAGSLEAVCRVEGREENCGRGSKEERKVVGGGGTGRRTLTDGTGECSIRLVQWAHGVSPATVRFLYSAEGAVEPQQPLR